MRTHRIAFTLLNLLMVATFTGCGKGPETGTVSGTITLDGQPVPSGLIRFIPVDGESQPDDCVINAGAYTVTIAPGEKRVEIFWQKEEGTRGDTATRGTLKQTQMIPDKYNTKSLLKHTIPPGKSTKDFELKSKE